MQNIANQEVENPYVVNEERQNLANQNIENLNQSDAIQERLNFGNGNGSTHDEVNGNVVQNVPVNGNVENMEQNIPYIPQQIAKPQQQADYRQEENRDSREATEEREHQGGLQKRNVQGEFVPAPAMVVEAPNQNFNGVVMNYNNPNNMENEDRDDNEGNNGNGNNNFDFDAGNNEHEDARDWAWQEQQEQQVVVRHRANLDKEIAGLDTRGQGNDPDNEVVLVPVAAPPREPAAAGGNQGADNDRWRHFMAEETRRFARNRLEDGEGKIPVVCSFHFLVCAQ